LAIPLARHGGCDTVAAVDRCSCGWRLVAAVIVVTLCCTPVVAQEAPAETDKPSEETPMESAPAPTPSSEPVSDYWPLLVAGIGVAAGGLTGARLARLEAERWEAIPEGTANRPQQIDTWNTWTVAGSVAATVGIGLIVLWATIRLSQASAAPLHP
jgi:hypothetical protein